MATAYQFTSETQLRGIKAPTDKRREDYVDTVEKGLRFRVTSGGRRSFVYRYNPAGSRTAKQIKLAAQQYKLPEHLLERCPVITPEISNRLEIRG